MKKFKRIFALLGAVLLVLLYVSTFIFALIDHSASKGLLKASIACTILLPVLLYAFTLVYKLTGKDDDSSKS
ncbi:MAG: hypothetical protein Q4C52_06530 [Eubacteriales bacterium]|nr:hypothetical protein [Eubacteriales bacterium]